MRTRQRVNTQTMNAPSVLASQRSPVASLLEFRDLVMGVGQCDDTEQPRTFVLNVAAAS